MEEARGRAPGPGPEPTTPVALPKGGGAIRGIDEKLDVGAATGTAGLTIPLPSSAGRGGMEPALALLYNSGAGNGPFGLGWEVALSSISRRTDDGLPQYRDAEESDIYLLSDAEDLVPQLRKQGGEWVVDEGAQSEGGRTYQVRRYRPRIDGLFARIERWWDQQDGAIHWRTVSPENVTAIYGRTDEGRIADPADPYRVFRWLLEFSYDDKGNCIRYRYKAEDLVGLDPAPLSEAHRLDGRSAVTNRYLKRVEYGARTPYRPAVGSMPDFLFELLFDYGEHDAESPTPQEETAWPVRADAFSDYRAGFEVRTYRLCRRILLFHRFAELGPEPCLVRSLDLAYQEQAGVSLLTELTRTGYMRQGDGSYSRKSFPPLTLSYQAHPWQTGVQAVAPESLEGAPAGIDGERYQWVDLYGEGLSGILSEQADGWFYKPNLGEGRFGPAHLVSPRPNTTGLTSGRVQVLDLEGDGRNALVSLDGPLRGFFGMAPEGGWEPFRPFGQLPTIDPADANLRLIDLDGDGRADLLVAEHDAFLWSASQGREGYGELHRVAKALNEELGPTALFADGTETIFLADMNGDGLSDLVRIRNGESCYWPNMGYGRFGAKVAMEATPLFDHPESFDPRRLRLADLDGTGPADLLYLGQGRVQAWLNQSGNRWAAGPAFEGFPLVDDLTYLSVLDLLGTGTACLVWASPLQREAGAPLRYIDLMGSQKPYLLTGYQNNLGKEVVLTYRPSTYWYRKDQVDGTPWVTRLPFPVHCVAKLEVSDRVTGARFASDYSYHHGYFDHAEREFRGFGRVDRLDTERFEHFVKHGAANVVAEELHQPPVLTKSWYHTGAFLDRERMLDQFAHEYYQNQQLTVHALPEPALPAALTAGEWLEAHRALKGLILRQEVYALDGTAAEGHPFAATQQSYAIQRLQPFGPNPNAAFLVTGGESIGYQYERNPGDPRIVHSLVLATDELGLVTRAATVHYPRLTADPALPPEVQAEQGRLRLTYTETDYTADVSTGAAYRLRQPCEVRSYELTGITPADDFFTRAELVAGLAIAATIPFEAIPDGSRQKRLIGQSRTLFRKDDLSGPLPLGQMGRLGLVYQSLQLSLTDGLVTELFGGRVTGAMLAAEGYLSDGGWWLPSAVDLFAADAADHFYLPTGSRDPLGRESHVEYDGYDLLLQVARDALGSEVRAELDYRLLQPVVVSDANENRAAVEADELGLVTRRAVMGKVGQSDGDSLADPTARMEYDLFQWRDHRKPVWVRSLHREKHGAANPRWQESYTYSDGSGNVVMVKAQTAPGLAKQVGPDGQVIEVDTGSNPRWVGNGRTVLNNKGNPVKQYEPYFSVTPEYEAHRDLVETGATPIFFYDPLGRQIRTEGADGSVSKREFGPWFHRAHDANDAVLESRWYADRGSPAPAGPEPGAPEQRAAWLAARHAGTPHTIHADSLGRAICTVADNGGFGLRITRSEASLTGDRSRLFDPMGRMVAEGRTSLLGVVLWAESAEKGVRWFLHNAIGNPVLIWDGTDRRLRTTYDELHRPLGLYLQEGGSPERLVTRWVYGESHPNSRQENLRGRLYRLFDQGGSLRSAVVDFKGNMLRVERRLATAYKGIIDWSSLEGQPDLAALEAAAEPLLEAEVFPVLSEVDALGRPESVTYPDQSVLLPSYDEANAIRQLQVRIRGAGAATTFLAGQSYDAQGRRLLAALGNQTTCRFTYDPFSFRLVRQEMLRDTGGRLQDLTYTYDPVGNITAVADGAQQTLFFANAVVQPGGRFEYDPLYQLLMATGREQAGGQPDHGELVPQALPHVNDAAAVRTYTERYEYDAAGNILRMQHVAGAGSWTRRYEYGAETNRLLGSSLPGDGDGLFSARYEHDSRGHMTAMPHLAALVWDFMDQLREVDLGGGGRAYYTYSADGERLRKVIERSGSTREETVYLGAVEIYRKHVAGALRLERETLHLSDGAERIARVDTKRVDLDDPTGLGQPAIRYQYGNHLGSASLELDESGALVSYEEYYPFGNTAYRSGRSAAEVSLKRYRFIGRERDQETGLYYCGARYYAPWLGRWTSADPMGFADGLNLFRYARNNPVRLTDPSGTQSKEENRTEIGSPFTKDSDPKEVEKWLRSRGYDFTGPVTWNEARGQFDVGEWLKMPGDGEGSDAGDGGATNQGAGEEESDGGDGETDPGGGKDEPPGGDDGEGDGGAEQGEGPGEEAGQGQGESKGEGKGEGTGQGEGGGEGDWADGIPNAAGQGAVSTWDTAQRMIYSAQNKNASAMQVEKIRDARSKGDVKQAWKQAEVASRARNVRRIQTQNRLSPGGRALSKAIEQPRPFNAMVEKYTKPGMSQFDVAEEVARAAGRSNKAMKWVLRFGKVAGPAAVVAGVGLSIREVINAPEGERARVAFVEAAGFAGGAIGYSVGVSLGASAAASIALALGLAAGPAGWLAIGLGFVGGAVVGWLGSKVFRRIGSWLSSLF